MAEQATSRPERGMQAQEVYTALLSAGEVPCDPSLVAGVRRLALRDGHRFSRSTSRDYMGRSTVLVSIHDGHGNLVFSPDMKGTAHA